MRRAVVALALLALAVPAGAAGLRLERQRIAVGETVELSVVVDDAQDVPAPTIPVPEGLGVDCRGQSTSVSIVNGRLPASTLVALAVTNSAPKRWACCFMFIMSSGPMIPSMKPGKFSTSVVSMS